MPIAISVVALVLAGLTYIDQHNVDVAADTASQEAHARLVSYYQNSPGSSTMIVQNLGQQPIFDVEAQITLIHQAGKAAQEQLAATYQTFELPPCSDTMVNFNDPGFLASLQVYSTPNTKLVYETLESNPNAWIPIPTTLLFTDANSRTWEINTIGALTEVANDTSLTYLGISTAHTIHTTPAHGCSGS